MSEGTSQVEEIKMNVLFMIGWFLKSLSRCDKTVNYKNR